jgi:hypothetical protein
MRHFSYALVLGVALLAAGCASVNKIATGDQVVGDRLHVNLSGAWNQVNLPGADTIVWTRDGVTLDALQFWVGVRDGQPMAPPGQDKRPLTFRAAMQPHEIAALMQGYYARDGSTVTVDKLEPSEFAGAKGVRIEFTMVRKFDEVRLSGLAFASVSRGELVALGFIAPRLGFFARHQPLVEQIARSARLKV